MRTARSAHATWADCASASEYTAMVRTPNRRHVRKTRTAISPRFATRTLLSGALTAARIPSPLRAHPQRPGATTGFVLNVGRYGSPRGSGTTASSLRRVPSGETPRVSHPEDPEGRGGDVGVERGGQAERQHRARVDRVDDAVVPQPRGRVVRVTLGLVRG